MCRISVSATFYAGIICNKQWCFSHSPLLFWSLPAQKSYILICREQKSFKTIKFIGSKLYFSIRIKSELDNKWAYSKVKEKIEIARKRKKAMWGEGGYTY